MFYFQAKKKKNSQRSPRQAKPTVSPVARSRQAHAFSTEKKKILQRIRKSNHHVVGREIKLVVDTTMPDTAYTEQIKLNSKPYSTLNSKPNTKNTERQRFLSKKKKKNTEN